MSIKTYHERVVTLNYTEKDIPKFNNQKDYDDWLKAIGRLVTYGIDPQGVDVDTVQLVNINLGQDESVACYYERKLQRNEDGTYLCSNTSELSNLKLRLMEGVRAFVLGAVKSQDGYGFHS